VDEVERGFTFRAGAPLDMRMGRGTAGEATAAELLNALGEAELAEIFWRYGEERRSRKLARIVVERRSARPLATSDDLVSAIDAALVRPTTQDRARIFQAVRIAVNRELEGVEAALPRLRDALEPGGVLVVLSYHSLEDRLVKEAFRSWSQYCICPAGLPVCRCRGVPLGETLTRKPLSAGEAEVARNPRARSVRLRAWRRA
jgi:16S rRNA (cytosine1402-N4)-methyltransferase